jgi:hypothetical protein
LFRCITRTFRGPDPRQERRICAPPFLSTVPSRSIGPARRRRTAACKGARGGRDSPGHGVERCCDQRRRLSLVVVGVQRFFAGIPRTWHGPETLPARRSRPGNPRGIWGVASRIRERMIGAESARRPILPACGQSASPRPNGRGEESASRRLGCVSSWRHWFPRERAPARPPRARRGSL